MHLEHYYVWLTSKTSSTPTLRRADASKYFAAPIVFATLLHSASGYSCPKLKHCPRAAIFNLQKSQRYSWLNDQQYGNIISLMYFATSIALMA